MDYPEVITLGRGIIYFILKCFIDYKIAWWLWVRHEKETKIK